MRTRRQNQAHGRTLAAALPLDLAAELLGEALDQPAAEPGVGASGIDSLAVVGDRQTKLARPALARPDGALDLARKSILDGIGHELIHNEPNRNGLIGRQQHALDIGLEHDGFLAFPIY